MLSFKTCGSFHFMKAGRWSVQMVRARDATPLKNARVINITRGVHIVCEVAIVAAAFGFMVCGVAAAASIL